MTERMLAARAPDDGGARSAGFRSTARNAGRPSTAPWDEIDPLLGRIPDREIARRHHCGRTTVARRRKRLGIPAWRKPRTDTDWSAYDWPRVEGIGDLRDEVIAARLGCTPDDVTEGRKAHGINRRRGPRSVNSRIDIIAKDPARASSDDVVFLVEQVESQRRQKDAARKSRPRERLVREHAALRCLVWRLWAELDDDTADAGLPERAAAVLDDVLETFPHLAEDWWRKQATRNGEGEEWASRNFDADPAPLAFLEHVLTTAVRV